MTTRWYAQSDRHHLGPLLSEDVPELPERFTPFDRIEWGRRAKTPTPTSTA